MNSLFALAVALRSAGVAAALLLCTAAHGSVVFSNFGVVDAHLVTGGVIVNGSGNIAVRFVPAVSGSLTDIGIAMKGGPSFITLSVCVDAGNRPGPVIASARVFVPSNVPQVLRARYASPVILNAGVVYWIKGASVGENAAWMPNPIGQTGYSFLAVGGAWNELANVATPALRLEDNSGQPAGACCAGATCAITIGVLCTEANTRYLGDGAVCNAAGDTAAPCCKADFNQSGGVSVQDVFDFLFAYFAGRASADINGDGVRQQDIFDFLAAYFSGCA